MLCRDQSLGDDRIDALSDVFGDLLPHVFGEHGHDSLHGLHGIRGMHGGKDKVPRHGGGDGGLHGFHVPHFAYDDDVRVFPQGAAQGFGKHSSGGQFPLGEPAEIVVEEVFDGIFQRQDMAAGGVVDVIEHGGKRGGFAAPGGTCDKNQSPPCLTKPFQKLFRKIQCAEQGFFPLLDGAYRHGGAAERGIEVDAEAVPVYGTGTVETLFFLIGFFLLIREEVFPEFVDGHCVHALPFGTQYALDTKCGYFARIDEKVGNFVFCGQQKQLFEHCYPFSPAGIDFSCRMESLFRMEAHSSGK